MRFCYIENGNIMRQEDVLYILTKEYSLNDPVRFCGVIPGYPHLLQIVDCKGKHFISKTIIDKGGDYFARLEAIYRNVYGNRSINIPIASNNGNLVFKYKNEGLLLFHELQMIEKFPNANWWAKRMKEIHGNKMYRYVASFRLDNFFPEKSDLYVRTDEIMPQMMRKKMLRIMNSVHQKEYLDIEYILNHGDLLQTNVLSKGGDEAILIDFESVCMAPKEYDIQRNLLDFAIHNTNSDIYDYYCELVESYLEQEKIQYSLMHDLCALDFCRTLCWLCGISQDKNRLDKNRQIKEYELFKNALEDGLVEKILSFCVMSEGKNRGR